MYHWFEDADAKHRWETEGLPKILTGACFVPAIKTRLDAAFDGYTGLEGLRGAFYLGAESCDCEGMIPNEYPSDDPKHKAFRAGYQAAMKIWP
jgi:hypothetical protein